MFENASTAKPEQKISNDVVGGSSSLFEGETTEEILTTTCEAHRISQEQFKQMVQYIEAHEIAWQQSNSDAIISHRLLSGLPRSIFWVRGEGAFIKLAGGEQERRMFEACRRTGLSPTEYRMIKMNINNVCYRITLMASVPGLLKKETSALATDVIYCPTEGLFLRSLRNEDLEASPTQPVWVGIEKRRDEDEINRGGFKNVVKALHLRSGKIVALGSSGRLYPEKGRIVNGKDAIPDSERRAFEVLSHPNIQSAKVIEYPGIKIDPTTDQYIVKRALISSWYPMGDVVSNISQLCTDEKTQIAADLFEALAYMHQSDNKKDGSGAWVHLDVKLDNLFLERKDGRIRAVLGDFGFAAPVSERRLFKGGTLAYASPETCSTTRFGEVGTHTDIWAAGVTLYALFVGKFPIWHPVKSRDEMISKYEKSAAFKKILDKDLKKNPIGELLKGMLRIRSQERLTAQECLEYFKGSADRVAAVDEY